MNRVAESWYTTIHFFRQQNSLFRQLVSFSPIGASFSPTFLTTRAFFTPNRQHRIGPYPGYINVPPRPPPLPSPPPTPGPPGTTPKKTCPSRPTSPSPRPTPRLATMVPRVQRPPLLEIRPAKARKALIKIVTLSPGGVSFSPSGSLFRQVGSP